MKDENASPDARSRPNSPRVSLLENAPGEETALRAEGRPGKVVSLPRPKWLRRRRRWLAAAAAAVMVLGALLGAAFYSPVLAVKNMAVQGNSLLSDAEVAAALEPLLGTPLPQIDAEDVHALLAEFPQVEGVTVEAHPPSSLVVQVQERTPVALLKDGKEFVLIDERGTRLGTVKAQKDAKLPLIDGGSEKLGEDIFEAITKVLAALPADILSRMEHASAKSIDSVELTLEGGERVLWGNATQKALKAQVLAALLQDAGEKEKAAGEKQKTDPVEVYDVSTPTRPVTR